MTLTPHQRRLRELDALRLLVSDLEALANSSEVGTVVAADVATIFERHTSAIPEGSGLRVQLERLSSAIRQGPARTRVEGLRQIVRKLHLQAEEFARVITARDARLRERG